MKKLTFILMAITTATVSIAQTKVETKATQVTQKHVEKHVNATGDTIKKHVRHTTTTTTTTPAVKKHVTETRVEKKEVTPAK